MAESHAFTRQKATGLLLGSAEGQQPVLQNAGVFVPEIWTAQLLQDLEDNLVLGSSEITNRQFEGQFRREGDRIRVPHFIDTVSDLGLVKAYDEIDDPQHASLEYISMLCQKGSSFHIEVDALHEMLSKEGINLMSELIRQRGRQAAISIDRVIAQTIVCATKTKDLNGVEKMPMKTESGKQVPDYDKLPELHGTVDTISFDSQAEEKVSAYDAVVRMLENLDVKNAPESRYLIISPGLRAMLLRDDKFLDASYYGGQAVIPSGVIGTILGVPVRVSNTLGKLRPAVNPLVKGRGHDEMASIDMMMGATSAVTLVIPFAQMAAYQPEDTFTDAIKSRTIWDVKVIRPEQLVVAVDVEKQIREHNKKVAGKAA